MFSTDQILAQFRAALLARDIVPPDPIVADGQLHRCHAAGPRGRWDAAYLLHLDGLPAGGMDNWRDGRGWQNWHYAGDVSSFTAAELAALQARRQAAEAARQADVQRRQADARATALRLWARARTAPPSHPYLQRKGVQPLGLRWYQGALVVPVQDLDGGLHSLQFISASGLKRFLSGGRLQGLGAWIGPPPVGDTLTPVLLAEGFATAASLHQATGHPVAVAFHAGNLLHLARVLRDRYPLARLVVCADDDHGTPGNPGLAQASAAAQAVGSWLARPDFGPNRPPGATDFNDLHRCGGLSAVLTSLAAATPPDAALDWPEPEALTAPLDALPYPVQALPEVLRDAVQEVQAFVQSPMALVACSALSVLSVAAQGLVNVRRDAQLLGPVSLYLLAVAESGERKSTCDRLLGAALREWERDQARTLAPEQVAHSSAVAIFEAKRNGLLEAVRRLRRDGQNTAQEEAALDELTGQAPQATPVPRLLFADATPEALSHALATGWPSGAVMSAEAGAVFGSHGMGQETLLRNLALLNVLWDGGEIAVDRRSKPSFCLRDRRLTFGLMVQPEALRGFLDRAGPLPRGTGFLARFLVAWPQSTQGSRPYRSAPAAMPAVAQFGERLRALLDTPLATDETGGLQPVALELSPAAHAAWVQAHDRIEQALGPGGEWAPVRDVAAKAAENIARLAALFHVLTTGTSGQIDATALQAASQVVAWHLHEARRLLADLDTPAELAAAIRLDEWLVAEAQRAGDGRIPTTRVYQFGPAAVREAKDLRIALAMLDDRDRARLHTEGRKRFVVVNPALWTG